MILQMEDIVSRCKPARVHLAILAAFLTISGSATAQHHTPKTPPPLQSYADPGAQALMREVMAAHREVKGLRFSVQNTLRSGNKAPSNNQVHVAFARPDRVRVSLDPRNFSAKGRQYDFLFDGTWLYAITRYQEVNPDFESRSKNKSASGIRYSKTERRNAEARSVYLSYISNCAVLPTIFSLLQGKNEITAPRPEPGTYVRQKATRLPSRIIDGLKVDGLQIRRSLSLGYRPYFQPAFTISYWFGANDHLLRRCQFNYPAQSSGGGIGIETGERLAPKLQPSFVTSHSLVAMEVNPAFTAADFRFVPPPGAIQTDEYGQPLPKP